MLIHVVLFKFKADLPAEKVQEACDRMLALQTLCLHPETRAPYITDATGGTNVSKEGVDKGFTHGFTSRFASTVDRDYYIDQDPAHRDFVHYVKALLEDILVVDYVV